jgi:hypothetical protein
MSNIEQFPKKNQPRDNLDSLDKGAFGHQEYRELLAAYQNKGFSVEAREHGWTLHRGEMSESDWTQVLQDIQEHAPRHIITSNDWITVLKPSSTPQSVEDGKEWMKSNMGDEDPEFTFKNIEDD